MKLIIGLGNPGKKYAKTRHNVGFMVLDALHEEFKKYDISDWSLSKKFNAEIAEVNIKNEKVILGKPMTFMNNSGEAVQLIMHYYKLKSKNLISVHDDKDLKLGKIKVQSERGDAGHNGVRSIIKHIGNNDFVRIRIGVASENEKKMGDTAKFVLNKFGIVERKKVKQAIEESVEEIRKLM